MPTDPDDAGAVLVAHDDDRAFHDGVDLVAFQPDQTRFALAARRTGCGVDALFAGDRHAHRGRVPVAGFFDFGQANPAFLRLVRRTDRIDGLFEVMFEEASQGGARDRRYAKLAGLAGAGHPELTHVDRIELTDQAAEGLSRRPNRE